MKCPKCGTSLPDGSRFCNYCGPIGESAGGVHDSVVNRSPGAGRAPSKFFEVIDTFTEGWAPRGRPPGAPAGGSLLASPGG